MTTKSASERIYGVLASMDIGFRFTAKQLLHICRMKDLEVTEGAVSSFIFRAKEKGMIDAVGRQHPAPRKSKSAVIYHLVQVVSWDFSWPSNGRAQGTTNLTTRLHSQEDLPFTDTVKGENPFDALAEEGNHYDMGMAGTTFDVPSPEFISAMNEESVINYRIGSVTEKLVQLIAEVNELENRPEKTLADYTSAELVAELARRLDANSSPQ